MLAAHDVPLECGMSADALFLSLYASTPPHLDLVLSTPYLSCKDSQASVPSQVYLTGNWDVDSRGEKKKKANSVIFFSITNLL